MEISGTMWVIFFIICAILGVYFGTAIALIAVKVLFWWMDFVWKTITFPFRAISKLFKK